MFPLADRPLEDKLDDDDPPFFLLLLENAKEFDGKVLFDLLHTKLDLVFLELSELIRLPGIFDEICNCNNNKRSLLVDLAMTSSSHKPATLQNNK